MGYGVYAEEPLSEKAKAIADNAEALARQVGGDDFQQRASSVEKALSEKPEPEQENLNIWRRVMRTDPQYTKPLDAGGFSGTSINAEYMFMRATELFGPVGAGWGYEVLEEKLLPGAPMSEAVYDDKGKFSRNVLLRDGDGTLIFEQNHSMKIEFWYRNGETRGTVEAYGATKYLYKSGNGRIIADSEAMKKSLTDAIKKALSLLGFSADIYLGWYDSEEYKAENKTEFEIRNASDKAEDVTRLRQELDDKLARVAKTLEGAITVNEATKVYNQIAREVETHRKVAEAKGDTEHARYLSGRLRRLTTIKDERIAALKAAEEKTA
jgi:hypothetical protein